LLKSAIKGRLLSKDEVIELLSIKQDDITMSLLHDLFAYRKNTNPRFAPNDFFYLEKGVLGNSERIKTTTGKYIFNLLVLYPNIIKHTGYFNRALDKGGIGKIQSDLGSLVLQSVLPTEEQAIFIDKMQWLAFGIAKFINASLTHEMLIAPEEVTKRKEELVEKHKEALEKGDLNTVNKIEKELIGLAKGIMQDVPDYQIYASGARGSFGNNYKNTSIMRGAIKNLADPSKVKVSTTSLDEGIPPEELPYYADLLTQASYQRAVGTQDGGYEGKKLGAAFQTIVLDDKGTNCGTKKFLKIILDGRYAKLFLYRYIKVGSQLVLLTPDNIDSYTNKVVELRSAIYCTGDQICNKCAGDLYYMMGIRNVGLLANRVGTSILNASLKAFHDMSLKMVDLDIDKYLD